MTGLVFGAVLGRDELQMAVRDAALANRARRQNGVQETELHRRYAAALTSALAAIGHTDVPDEAVVSHFPVTRPTMTIEESALVLGLSRRQTRRLAPELGGRITSGRWLVDEDLVREYAARRSA